MLFSGLADTKSGRINSPWDVLLLLLLLLLLCPH
jgi:hypothetical protein